MSGPEIVNRIKRIFNLKRGDTFPVIEVELLNPDETVHDLTGSTAWVLRVALSDGTFFHRAMSIYGDPEDGLLRYAWQATDWDELIVSPDWELGFEGKHHRMDYQVLGSGAAATFPNRGFHVLQISPDIGEP